MPGVNDAPEQVQPIVDRAKEAGATFLGGVALHLRDEVRNVFFAWLETKRPDLIPRYEQLYANGRAYLPAKKGAGVTKVVRGWGKGGAVRKKAPHTGSSSTGGRAQAGSGRAEPASPTRSAANRTGPATRQDALF
jgi:hypothetical protein